jgi:hypothetical protein
MAFGRLPDRFNWRSNVRINVSPFRFVLCALVALTLWGAPAFSQHPERGTETETDHHHIGAIHDWTHDHVLYPRFGPMNRLIALQNDRRAIQHWEESYRKDYARWRGGEGEGHRSHHHKQSSMKRDWAIFLGNGDIVGGTTNIAVYPAKWTFDINETVTGPTDTNSCLNDYLVVPVNATGADTGIPPGPGQPNIIGLNNLYRGTAGASGTGVCNNALPPANDDGVSATTYFSYAVIGDNGIAATSPETSLDGTKIAFVEGTGAAAHFHVLAWNAGDGNNNGVALGRQDPQTNALQICHQPAVAPCTGAQDFVAVEPTITGGHGNATDLTLGSAPDSISSPYVDYSNDVVYVGNDAGQVFKIKNVFCPTWAPCAGAAPSLDTSFNTTGVLGFCTGAVSGITVDGAAGNVFAGCADGFLYEITPTGTVVGSLQIGDGNSINGGIVDAPTLDEVNGWVYAETGSCSNATLTSCSTLGSGFGFPTLVQASMANLATNSAAYLGPFTGVATDVNPVNMHAPAWNDAYFTSGSSGNWILYDYSSDLGNGGEIVLYGITFNNATAPNAAHVMDSGQAANALNFTIGNFEISPMTEFFTTGGEDRLFASADGYLGPGNIVSWRIDTGFPVGPLPESNSTQGIGTSGIVADNTSSAVGQANSIYFGVLGTVATVSTNPNVYSVVKLTQVDLQ